MIPKEIHFWAKTVKKDGQDVPGISVRDHCLNVGCVAEALIKCLPPSVRNLLPPSTATLAALHDIGKISVGFQRKCEQWLVKTDLKYRDQNEDWNLSESDHGKISCYILSDWLRKRFPDTNIDDLAHVLGAHHGSLFGKKILNRPLCEKGKDITSIPRQILCAELEAILTQLPSEIFPLNDTTLFLLAGLTSVADWIASDERFFSADYSTIQNLPRSTENVRVDVIRAITELGWKIPIVQENLSLKELFDFETPSEIQHRCSNPETIPSLLIIEDVMGSGKTEAALVLAYHLIQRGKANGIYFALPTQVTSNRIHLRMQKFLQRCLKKSAMLRLVHMNSWLRDDEAMQINSTTNDDATSSIARSWFVSAKRALLAPFGVGTIDQALLGVVAAKHFFVRQFGLAGKVVILDEVHTYDLYTGTLVQQLVCTLRKLNATVIILSATLTTQRKREILDLPDISLENAYPLLTNIPLNGGSVVQEKINSVISHEVQVRCVQLSEFEVVTECLRRAERGECVLWIRNTVSEAQSSFKHLRSERRGDKLEIALLHSRFPLFRREQLELLWLNRLGKNPRRRPKGCVLISTQVVEQSVDIDADFLITELAPTDMILQRIGRLWRHQEKSEIASRRPENAKRELWINTPHITNEKKASELKAALGKSARVYAPYVLLRSLAKWQSVSRKGSITLPNDIRTLIEETYDSVSEINEPPSWSALHDELKQEIDELRQNALGITNVWGLSDLKDEEGIQTRWSKVQYALLLLVRSARFLNKNVLHIEPLHGHSFTIASHQWQTDPKGAFKATKIIHQNCVRVAQWMIRDGLSTTRDVLGHALKGFHDNFALGILDGVSSGPIRWPGPQKKPSRLYYNPDLGVFIEDFTSLARSDLITTYKDDDESND